MKRIALAALLLTGACGGYPPPNGYQPASLPSVLAVVNGFWGTDAHDVWLVVSDCDAPGAARGYTSPASGACVRGVTLGEESWVADRNQDKYSVTSLCHELAHHTEWGRADHRHLDARWAQVADCNAALMNSGVDEI